MKLKLLTVLFFVVYILSITTHFKDFSKGFKDGNQAATCGVDIYNLNIAVPDTENTFIIHPNKNTTITKSLDEEKVTIETKDHHTNYLKIPTGILVFMILPVLPLMLFFIVKLFKGIYKGEIVSKKQINRLTFLSYAHLSFAVIENLLTTFENFQNHKVANFYGLTLIKEANDFSLFFIPIVLLIILEVLKQSLRLKEEAELTI